MALLTALLSGTTITASEVGYSGPITAVSSNPQVAQIMPASANGPTAVFKLVGFQAGKVSVTLQDTNDQQIVLTDINVVPGSPTLVITPAQLTFADPQEGLQVAVVTANGTPPYAVTSADAAIATGIVSGAVVLIGPQGLGVGEIIVTDADLNYGVVTITVAQGTPSFQEALVQYLGSTGSAPPAVMFTDLQIQEVNPGIEFNPQEIGGLWEEFRENNGDLWIATNATFSGNGWSFINSSNDAWALKLARDGSVIRYRCPAGSSVFTWVSIWMFDALGNLTAATNTTLTTALQVPFGASPIWNSTVGAVMRGRVLDVTDTLSASASLLDDLRVNNASVWSVRKDGLLVAGTVPAGSVVGTFPISAFGIKNGSTPNVPADGSAPVTITFPVAFTTLINQVLCQITDARMTDIISLQVVAKTLTNFEVWASGGQTGSVIGVDWFAYGA